MDNSAEQFSDEIFNKQSSKPLIQKQLYSQQYLAELRSKFSHKFMENLFFAEEIFYELSLGETNEYRSIYLLNKYMQSGDDSSYI